jgi:hypothetical protein
LPLELAFIELLPAGKEYELAEPLVKEPPPQPRPAEPEEKALEAERPAQPAAARKEEVIETVQPPGPEPPQAESVVKTESQAASAKESISLELVVRKWPKLRELVGQSDKGLPRLLASGTPLAMEGTKLILGFEFPILKERFDGQKGANAAVAGALQQLLDTDCRVETVVTEQYQSRPAQVQISEDDIIKMADELGGVVRPQQ